MKKNLYLMAIAVIFLMGCEEGGLLIERDISQDQVSLLSPGEGVEIPLNSIQFDWQSLEDATSYELQVATPNFDDPQQFLVNMVLDSVTTFETSLSENSYEWRVRAKNSNYETDYTYARFSVVPVINFSDNTLILLSPENNLITNEAAQELHWEAISEATLYRVQILENGIMLSEEVTQNTTLTIQFPEGDLEWQVRAENGLENTEYSIRNILVDITDPNTPNLVTPADGSTLTTSEVTFEWTRELIEGSAEKDSIYVYRDVNLNDLVLKEEASSPYQTTLDNDTYYWLVKAFDQAGNESENSNVFSFTVNSP